VTADAALFWILTVLTVGSALGVILMRNPIFCALSLALTMTGVAAVFVTLNAAFLAGVQLIVYAGAVMVLFVMVLMLFDLKHELQTFSRGKISGALKIAAVGTILGVLIGSIYVTTNVMMSSGAEIRLDMTADNTKQLGQLLFSQYLFGFEALGVLLLVVAIGAVALSRSRGGTHAER
jgi:NADH-quinone oxidoreductase subunit J